MAVSTSRRRRARIGGSIDRHLRNPAAAPRYDDATLPVSALVAVDLQRVARHNRLWLFELPDDVEPPRPLSADRALPDGHLAAGFPPRDVLGAIGKPARHAGAVP